MDFDQYSSINFINDIVLIITFIIFVVLGIISYRGISKAIGSLFSLFGLLGLLAHISIVQDYPKAIDLVTAVEQEALDSMQVYLYGIRSMALFSSMLGISICCLVLGLRVRATNKRNHSDRI